MPSSHLVDDELFVRCIAKALGVLGRERGICAEIPLCCRSNIWTRKEIDLSVRHMYIPQHSCNDSTVTNASSL